MWMMNSWNGAGKPSHSSSTMIDIFLRRIAILALLVELLVQGNSSSAE
jgi:hypothetical protein